MAHITDDSLDAALNYIKTNAETLHILKADPLLNFANIATHGVGSKTLEAAGASFAALADGATSGRMLTLNAITDGSVSATNTATHYAITDDSATKVLASGILAASQAVTSGNTFTLTALYITIPDAA